MAKILSNVNRFSVFFHWKFGVNWLSTIPQLLIYAVKLHINIRKQAINDNLQGGCGGSVNNQIKQGLFLKKVCQ